MNRWIFVVAVAPLGCDALDRFDLPPTAPVVRITPARPEAGDALTCAVIEPSLDPEGAALRYAFDWAKASEASLQHTGPTLPADRTREGEVWSCHVTAHDGLNTSPTATATVAIDPAPTPVVRWLREHRGGYCLERYNQMVNLCGDVEFCEDPEIMRPYPGGIAIDLGFHWDGDPGRLVDLGGDCELKRVAVSVDRDGDLLVEPFAGSPALEARLAPGTHLLSYRATTSASALFIDGELTDSGTGTSTTPALLGRCGPGVVLGQRLSYWWEPGKRDVWLRFAPFFFHLRELSEDPSRFDLEVATTPSARSVLLFEPSGAEATSWRSSISSHVAAGLDGSTYVEDAFGRCLLPNAPPSEPAVTITPALPTDGEPLTCAITRLSVDAEQDAIRYAYRWIEGGVESPRTSSVVPAGVVEAGQTWTCVVTPMDDLSAGPSASASVLITGAEPCHSVVVTSSAARVAFANHGYAFGERPWTVELWLQIHDRFGAGVEPILTMNEDLPEHAIRSDYNSRTGAVTCYVYGQGEPEMLRANSGDLRDGRWHHVACVYQRGVLRIFIDGNPGAQVEGGPADIRASSATALGHPRGLSNAEAAPVALGPIRISSVARYLSRFRPAQRWGLDADTVSQHLVELGFDGATVVDEAGGDNTGIHERGVVAHPPSPACP